MTTLTTVELDCINCNAKFTTQKILSTNSFGGKRTDFHERAAGAQPLPYLIYTCSQCGYSALPPLWEDPKALNWDTQQLIKDKITPQIIVNHKTGKPVPITGSLKYEWAALILTQEEAGASGMGAERKRADLWLRAAWCAVDEGDTEAERYYRLKSAKLFARAINLYEEVESNERAILTYLVGELYRRAGHVKLAQEWFAKVELEIVDDKTQEWVFAAAQQQRSSPREWFG